MYKAKAGFVRRANYPLNPANSYFFLKAFQEKLNLDNSVRSAKLNIVLAGYFFSFQVKNLFKILSILPFKARKRSSRYKNINQKKKRL